MKKRLKETFALILTVVVTFISYFGAVPVHAQTPLNSGAIVALANQDRMQSGARRLVADAVLAQAAQAKANDMAAKGYFSHIDPSGNAPWMWLKNAGYYYWSAGENLAINFNDAGALNSAWMNSPGHRANILNNSYSRVGVGIAQGMYQGRPATFIVEFFADPYLSKVAKR